MLQKHGFTQRIAEDTDKWQENKGRPAPVQTGQKNSVKALERVTLNPNPTPKIIMPTSSFNITTRHFTLFSFGESFVDVPPNTEFLRVEEDDKGQTTLVCRVHHHDNRIEWRRVVGVPAGGDLRPYAGWSILPRQSGTILWFLDPKPANHNPLQR